MKIKDRYIANTLLTYSIVVLLVWLSIYSFFNFLAELNNVGKVNYTILEAFKYIILQLPEVAYEQVSPVILLGCILGMGHLATTGQLIILRASGISVLKITWLTLKNAIIFLILITMIGELVAPTLSSYAENERSNALGQNSLSGSQDGFWIRDGDNFINVKNNINGSIFNDITVIEVNNESNKIERVVESKSAIFDGQNINMDSTNIFSINSANSFDDIALKERNLYKKRVAFDQDLIDSLEKEPKDLTTFTILKQIQFLTDNKLRAEVFEVELYKRLVKPITLVAMILLAMLFIFGSTRDATLGRKIFFGVAIGLSFELISRIGGALALSFDFSPLLSTFVPAIAIMIIAIIVLINKSIH
ncbi:LPS export ABC transporter permease LptG [Candidatus Pseudothioglobus singularis]|nr:LPS export ABC transporter permease LptG [Candidatus Pseudothioglobus singularis]